MKHPVPAECVVDGCTKHARSLRSGLCYKHYWRQRNWGNPHYNPKIEAESPEAGPPITSRPITVAPPPGPPGSMYGQRRDGALGPEHAVALPGVEPVRCHACGHVVSATPDPVLVAAAQANHRRYCHGRPA